MHQTKSVDVLFVIECEIRLELEGGDERLISARDRVIQNGAKHARHSRSDAPCRALAIALGASTGDKRATI